MTLLFNLDLAAHYGCNEVEYTIEFTGTDMEQPSCDQYLGVAVRRINGFTQPSVAKHNTDRTS